MSVRIEESFTVRASVEEVWRYLIDPRRVVECLPGATLVGQEDDRTYLGTVKVKVGPVTAAYSGKAVLGELHEADHRVLITAEGRESAGPGSARLRMTSTISPEHDGLVRVRVEAELDVAGKIVQFGRGMIETVNKQLFAQFTACVRSTLESPGEPPEPMRPNGSVMGVSNAAAGGAHGATAVDAGSAPTRAARAAEPVRLVPLLFKALVDWIGRLFGRRRAG